MRIHLEFRSSAFPPYPGEEEQINPDLYGRRLAEFVAGVLSEAGFKVDEPDPEDWGWYVTIANEEFPLWDGFLCFIEPSKPFVRKWFRKVSTEDTVHQVADVLERALDAHPEVRELRWWTDEESARGRA